MSHAPVAAAMGGMTAGASIVFWAFGTWLIPALIAAGLWRHVVHRIPVRYDPTWWSAVFPLGMYGVGAQYLRLGRPPAHHQTIGADESWVALAAWVLTFLGMLRHLYRTLLRPTQPPQRRPAGPRDHLPDR